MIEMKRGEPKTKIEAGIEEQEQKIEEEVARKIKAGIEKEGFYKIEFELQKRFLKRTKFEEGETVRSLVHNIMEKYGDEGLQLLKYVEFGEVDEKSLVKIIRELECIPIIRECGKLINRLIGNEDKTDIEVCVDWERQYREEVKQRQAIEAKLKVIKTKYEGALSILQKKSPQEKKYSEREANRIFDMFDKRDLKSLKKALSKDPSLIFVKNLGETLIHKGVWNGWIEGMEAVMEHGVGIEGFIDRVDEYIKTPLMIAIRYEKFKVIPFLVSNGADIEAKDDEGETALMRASRFNNLDIVEFLISKGANIEAKDNNGMTALLIAITEDNLKVVEFLISKRANIEEKDNNGFTALIMASYLGYLEIVKFLISKGAKIEEKSNDGKTALMIASEEGRPGVVEFLKSKGVKQ